MMCSHCAYAEESNLVMNKTSVEEFTAALRNTTVVLATRLRIVGVASIVLGFIALVIGVVDYAALSKVGVVLCVLGGIGSLANGWWLRGSAASFGEVGRQHGKVMSHLATALDKLRLVYSLQMMLLGVAVTCVLVVLALHVAR